MSVSVIIPTTCELRRKASLLHAIDSVIHQAGVGVAVIVVVNGNRYDPELLEQLRVNPHLQVEYREEASAPAAQRHGRTLVKTDYFAFLDDDDEYYPAALQTRLAPMLRDPTLDVVVTNGDVNIKGVRQRKVQHTHTINSDPIVALLNENWLASCGGVYRSATITTDFFDGHSKFFEWTLLVFRLVLAKRKILFLDQPTYLINITAQSLSNSHEYHQSLVGFLSFLLKFDTSPRIVKALKRKLAAAWHGRSQDHLAAGQIAKAWQCHFKSLRYPGGLKYLSYTWHLCCLRWPSSRGAQRG